MVWLLRKRSCFKLFIFFTRNAPITRGIFFGLTKNGRTILHYMILCFLLRMLVVFTARFAKGYAKFGRVFLTMAFFEVGVMILPSSRKGAGFFWSTKLMTFAHKVLKVLVGYCDVSWGLLYCER